MKQRATVVEVKDKIAVIETTRKSMCEGCKKRGSGCSGHCDISGLVANNGKMRAEADNAIGAAVGDVVEIETEDKKVLSYAAIVFLLPIILTAACYQIMFTLFSSELAGYIGAAAGFVLTFVGLVIYDKIKSKNKNAKKDMKIVNRL